MALRARASSDGFRTERQRAGASRSDRRPRARRPAHRQRVLRPDRGPASRHRRPSVHDAGTHEDHDRPSGVLAIGRQPVEPTGDILAIEPDRTQAGIDVLSGPLVLEHRLGPDVGSGRRPPADQPALGRSGRPGSAVGDGLLRRRRGRPLRWVGAELAGPLLPGLGVDPIETHDPLAPLLPHRRLTCRLPPHRPPPQPSAACRLVRGLPQRHG